LFPTTGAGAGKGTGTGAGVTRRPQSVKMHKAYAAQQFSTFHSTIQLVQRVTQCQLSFASHSASRPQMQEKKKKYIFNRITAHSRGNVRWVGAPLYCF